MHAQFVDYSNLKVLQWTQNKKKKHVLYEYSIGEYFESSVDVWQVWNTLSKTLVWCSSGSKVWSAY